MYHVKTKDNNYRQLQNITKGWIQQFLGSNDGFEPDAIAVHSTSIENFLVGKPKDSDYLARPYKGNVD